MTERLMHIVRRHGVGLMALVVALVGTSYAVTANRFVGGDGQVTACVKKSGAVRLVAEGRGCRKKEEQVTWSQRGPAGPPGAAASVVGVAAGGDLTGTYPAPTIAAAATPADVAENPRESGDPCDPQSPAPAAMTLCGTISQQWRNGGFGVEGLQVWRDRLGQVHIRGSASLSTGTIGALGSLFILPPDLRPKRILGFPIGTGQSAGAHAAGTALLIVYPDSFGGFVAVFSASVPSHSVVHLGEILFRTDA